MAILSVTNHDFEEKVLKAQQPVLVDFWAPWCVYCRRLAPVLDRMDEMCIRDRAFGDYAPVLERLGVQLSLGERYLEGLKGQDMILRTPGFEFYTPELQQAARDGSCVTSEMELDVYKRQAHASGESRQGCGFENSFSAYSGDRCRSSGCYYSGLRRPAHG